MRRLSYEWLAGLREIVIDPYRCPKTFEEFTLKEYLRTPDGSWVDETSSARLRHAGILSREGR